MQSGTGVKMNKKNVDSWSEQGLEWTSCKQQGCAIGQAGWGWSDIKMKARKKCLWRMTGVEECTLKKQSNFWQSSQNLEMECLH